MAGQHTCGQPDRRVRKGKSVIIVVPPALLAQIDAEVARSGFRNRSEYARVALTRLTMQLMQLPSEPTEAAA